ncbi:MAG TPA: head-tail adaptor protein [Clostridium sp.]|nr:head-tail adaptor protein [Clostridium sp.]
MAQLKNVSSKNNLSLDNVCYLILQTFEEDDIGQQIAEEETETMCFCSELAVASSEFRNAGLENIKSEKSLLVDSESYNDELIVKYNNVRYSLYRNYPRTDGMTELYLTKKAGV